jgi:integrase/recombinase XerD
MSEGLTASMRAYLTALESRNYSAQTLKVRATVLLDFRRFLKTIDHGADPRAITAEAIARYRTHLETRVSQYGRRFSVWTIQGYLISLRGYFTYLVRGGELLSSPMADLRLPMRGRPTPRAVLSAVEVERILSLPDVTTARGLRDRALLETMYSSALRRGEVCNLLIRDVDLTARTLFVRQGKFHKDRLVPVTERAALFARRYQDEARPALLRGTDHGHLFVNDYGRPLQPTWLTGRLRGMIANAGIEKAGACHIFRHSAATLMLENGASIRHIQEFLGHENPSTTQIYTRVSAADLRRVHRRTHPADDGPAVRGSESVTGRPRRIPFVSHKPEPADAPEPERGTLAARLKSHLTRLQEQGFAEATIKNRKRYVRPFVDFCAGFGVARPAGLSPAVLEEYRGHVRTLTTRDGRPLAVRTLHAYLVHMVQFVRALYADGALLFDITAGFEMPRRGRSLPARVLTADEAERILKEPDTATPFGVRDRAILELLYCTGMRRGELQRLTVPDVDLARETVLVISSKTKTERVLPLNARTLHWLERYLSEVRPLLQPREDMPLVFLATHGGGFHPNMLTVIISRYIKRAGLVATPNLFRHTVATLMLEGGADLRHVQELLGHSELNTTRIYTHLSIRALKEAHDRTHPARMRYEPTQSQPQRQARSGDAGGATKDEPQTRRGVS